MPDGNDETTETGDGGTTKASEEPKAPPCTHKGSNVGPFCRFCGEKVRPGATPKANCAADHATWKGCGSVFCPDCGTKL
ncbi:MAG: hypothetical protein A2898_03475 [Candidatus Kerfeldbacteria bacterium RIFCSPLOWO2_01_FULL_48_11]|uniref:Uncharacterized protein n=1 Tax=Candidatus Kerfeldbacteria bacterium RIFCSPLOWO2_01_FULL_48_11 TaxID=1798543 RepID=A0A1G2B2B4_9BACT|nr:MAG: hypothetical protein UY34_C0009G0041 [Parcubacteria group bacterium GW2011_GWA2_48_9]KKW16252.1 MAG: hypothetical protein UY52_C0007G0012 [Parcubacteria group bacterium GW2011_GWC2_49_9]OGY83322.1 MAG: hypothetical protein A2898_03475 [Candidatus Kerfeldbacteria bacterium RIFCSPLOWO2_01_FULL_48_11]HCJ52133.1 hypothetical protein [Candidatus Kerfeldbacteria bacterium]